MCSACKLLICFDITGSLLGETFIVRQMIPLLKHVIHSCIGVSNTKKPEPVQSWSALALIDSLVTISGLVALLPKEVILRELIQVWISVSFCFTLKCEASFAEIRKRFL